MTVKDLERFRASGTNYTVPSKEVLTTVKIVTPGKDVFIRTHPDPAMEFTTFTFETRDGHILIDPDVFEAIRAKVKDFHKFSPCVTLRPYITNKGSVGLWPLKRESPFSIGGNSYNRSAFNISDLTRTRWLRVSSNQERSEYLGFDPDAVIPEPKWPENLTIYTLLELVMKGGMIDGPDQDDRHSSGRRGHATAGSATRGRASAVLNLTPGRRGERSAVDGSEEFVLIN